MASVVGTSTIASTAVCVMSVRQQILVACLGFVAIVVTLGGLAQQHATRMARLAVGIYDNSFIGMSYVAQAREAFVHLAEEVSEGAAPSHPPGRAKLREYLITWMLRWSGLLRTARERQDDTPGNCWFN
jgi:hypothetical protein